MGSTQLWNNIIAYALQIGLLVGVGALAPPLLQLKTPRARLLFWQVLLVACLALPWVQPWRQEAITVSNTMRSPIQTGVPFIPIVLWLLAGGVTIRLTSLGIGLARLAGYRRRSHTFDSDPVFSIATAASARWFLSDEIPGPVTFGWRDPVVLLPARFPSLRADLRDAILCHELIHVERRDWVFTFAEEIVRAVFWFHPAIWWVLGEIQLAREQTVDESVVEITHARGHYVDALLAVAGAEASGHDIDLAPAPLFLRKRHFKKRVIGLLQEARTPQYSSLRLALSQAIAIVAIAGVSWTVSEAFPLAAAPQLVTDAAGVVVNTGDAKILHRTPVAYPDEAIVRGVQGRVIVQANVDADGHLSDETVVNCARELCQAAMDSLPDWQFDTADANTTHAINIDFVNPVYVRAAVEPVAWPNERNFQ